MQGSYLGPIFGQEEIERDLNNVNANFEIYSENEIIEQTAESLKMEMQWDGFKEGWSLVLELQVEDQYQQILGHRLCKKFEFENKYRESFRPFAPSVIREEVDKWFKINEDSPYMLLVLKSWMKKSNNR